MINLDEAILHEILGALERLVPRLDYLAIRLEVLRFASEEERLAAMSSLAAMARAWRQELGGIKTPC